MTRWIKRTGLAIFLVCVLIATYWFWSPKRRQIEEPFFHYASEQLRTLWSGNLIQRESRKLVGSSAVDCGVATRGKSRTDVEDCIIQSWSARRAFQGRWDVTNYIYPPVVQDGLLGTSDGHLYHFRYTEGSHLPEYRQINIANCPQPFKLAPDNMTGRLGCYGCDPGVFKTPAIYFEHIGDEDKPIYPMVIATKQPTEEELRCALPASRDSLLLGAGIFIVTNEEMTHALKLLAAGKPAKRANLALNRSDQAMGDAEFSYLFSAEVGKAEPGLLTRTQSLHLFSVMSDYFKSRQPRLDERLAETFRRF